MFDPEPEPDEDIFDLTSDMIAEDEDEDSFAETFTFNPEPAPRTLRSMLEEEEESLLAPPTQAASTGALAELARAVARERGIGLGNGGITLEDLVREILKALIKDWLDANLPYMIERIVKKEIEKMVNRAEKL
jgi:cell pole-organizing protein PopZ